MGEFKPKFFEFPLSFLEFFHELFSFFPTFFKLSFAPIWIVIFLLRLDA